MLQGFDGFGLRLSGVGCRASITAWRFMGRSSWVVISRVISRVTILLTHIRGLIL